MIDVEELSAAERKAIGDLKRLAARWPKRLWLFSANGTLHVMLCGEDGGHVHRPSPDNGIDPDYCVDTIRIPNDGGDW